MKNQTDEKKPMGFIEPELLSAALCQNQRAILKKINPKMLSTYCWLMDELHRRNVFEDQEYRRKFGGYYRMRFVSQRYRDAFFALFQEVKSQSAVSFEEVAAQLYLMDKRHEFSFISKMLHTVDPPRPIYDSQVGAALHIRRTYQADLNRRLRQDAELLDSISAYYRELKSHPQAAELLNAFDQIAPAYKISVEKSWISFCGLGEAVEKVKKGEYLDRTRVFSGKVPICRAAARRCKKPRSFCSGAGYSDSIKV